MRGKKTGGRQKGTPNKANALVQAMVAKYKYDPLEILLMFAQGDWQSLGYDSEVYHMEKADGSTNMGYVITPNMRMKAAAEVVQYIHPRKKEKEDNTEIDVTSLTLEEKQRLLEEAKREIVKLEEEINESLLGNTDTNIK